VLEALRLLEAFQAVAKHGVLCPIDWKPSDNAQDTLNTIANTLTESYDERLANLQKEFDGTTVTDLDAKHKRDEGSREAHGDAQSQKSAEDEKEASPKPVAEQKQSSSLPPPPPAIQEVVCQRPKQLSPSHSIQGDCLPHPSSPPPVESHAELFSSTLSTSAPNTAPNSPLHTPRPAAPKTSDRQVTARRARGRMSSHITSLFSHHPPAPSIFRPLRRYSSQSQSSDSPSDTD
jgi:hypothetical protein